MNIILLRQNLSSTKYFPSGALKMPLAEVLVQTALKHALSGIRRERWCSRPNTAPRPLRTSGPPAERNRGAEECMWGGGMLCPKNPGAKPTTFCSINVEGGFSHQRGYRYVRGAPLDDRDLRPPRPLGTPLAGGCC